MKWTLPIVAVATILISITNAADASNEPLRIIDTFGDGVAMQSVIVEFSKRQGIATTVKYMRQDEFKTNLLTLIATNELADIAIIPADHLGLHNLANFSVVVPTNIDATIAERLWDTAVSDGVIRGIPLTQGNHLVMYYNKALAPRPAKSWDEMLDQKMLFDKKPIPHSTIQWNHDDPFYFLPFLSAFDGWPLINGEIKLNTQSMIDALNYYKYLRDKKLYSTTCNYECASNLFMSGKLAYNINGTWVGDNYAQVLGASLGVAQLPSINGRAPLPSFSTYVIAFPNNSLSGAKKDAIMDFVKFMMDSNVQLQLWTSAGAIPTESKAFDHALENSTGYLKDTLTLLDKTKPLPADQSMTFLWDAIMKGLMRQNVGVMEPKETAFYMQKLGERHVRNAKRDSETFDKRTPK